MKKQVTVSDFSGAEIQPGQGATIRITFDDRRKGEVVADASLADDLVGRIISSGRATRRRGRKPAGQEVGS